MTAKPQTDDRELAESIAKRHSKKKWKPLADEIEAALAARFLKEDLSTLVYDWAADQGYSLCDGYCHEFCGSTE